MNKVILMGRLTRDADIRYSVGEEPKGIARFILAVDRRYRQDTDITADFISCVGFGNVAAFMERFGKKGTKFLIEGRIQTGSFINANGDKVYTTDVIVENAEFAESKKKEDAPSEYPGEVPNELARNGFLPEDVEEELPFK